MRAAAAADLAEQYALDVAARGRLRALLWYVREALSPSVWRLRRECRRQRDRQASRGNDRERVAVRMVSELRTALRSLWHQPAFTVVTVATLALGVGANVAVFAVFNSVMLRPLPYAAADRIGIVWEDLGDGAQSLPAVSALDYLDYVEWRDRFEAFTLATGREVVVTGTDEPELVDGGNVVAGFLEFFGGEPLHGRWFTEAEDVPGGPAVVVLSHRLWQRRYGGRPEIVGRTIDLDGQAHEVIGVVPSSFRLLLPGETFRLRDAQLWRPAQIDPARQPPRNFTGYTVFGRLAPDATFAEGQVEMEAFAARLRELHPVHATANSRLRIVPLHADVVKAARRSLNVLLAAVVLVLLVACANVAGLFLARAAARRRDAALRAALGASRARLLLSGLAESVCLALAGSAAGLVVAWVLVRIVVASAGSLVPRLTEVSLDAAAVAFAALITVGVALAFGCVPALHGAAGDLSATLRSASRTGSPRSSARALLVGAETALAVVLLVGAGLLVRSFVELQSTDPGFDARRAITFRVRLPDTDAYRTRPQQLTFFTSLRERLESIPGVLSVSGIDQLPLTGRGALQPFAFNAETARNWESVTADQRAVLPGFFATMAATLVAGRDFDSGDTASSPAVIVIDESLARMAWPEEPAVGRRLQVEPDGTPESFAEVVGVVRHVRLNDVGADTLPQIFLPMQQVGWRQLSYVVRTEGELATVTGAVRDAVRQLDAGTPVNEVRTLQELVDRASDSTRFSLWLMAGLASLAIALVAIGIYGIVSWTVSSSLKEIGIRLALGQTPSRQRGEILASGARVTVAGTIAGLVGAALLSRVLSGLLYGVRALDPFTYIAVALVVAVVTLAASWLPGARATRVDPAITLRTD